MVVIDPNDDRKEGNYMSQCCFCDSDKNIVFEDVDGKKVCQGCYERESDTGEVH